MRLRNTPAFLGAFIVLSLVSVGCATKKHVREAIAPVQNQVNQTQSQVSTLQKQTDENKQSIGDLDRQGATAADKTVARVPTSTQAATAAPRATCASCQTLDGTHADNAC